MVPRQTLYFNFVFTQVEFACTKCHKKIAVSGKMMIGASLFTGLMGLVSADPIYMFGGVVVAAMPFYRRMRNPVMSEETIALGAGIIPDNVVQELAQRPRNSEPKSTSISAAEEAIDRAVAASLSMRSPPVRRPIAAAERFHGSRSVGDDGFGRRRRSAG